MNLPHKNTKSKVKSSEFTRITHKPSKAPLVLSIVALCISVVSIAFAGYLYATQPQRINNYVEAHKNELKGDKGDTGDMGPRGFSGADGLNGSNSYAPTYCSTYDYSFGSSTSCY